MTVRIDELPVFVELDRVQLDTPDVPKHLVQPELQRVRDAPRPGELTADAVAEGRLPLDDENAETGASQRAGRTDPASPPPTTMTSKSGAVAMRGCPSARTAQRTCFEQSTVRTS